MNKFINKRNGIIAGIAVVFIIIAVVATTSFSSAMNLDKAKDIAQQYVPSDAKFVGSEEEDRYFEVAFYDEDRQEGFEVEVNKETGEVKKLESQLSNDLGSKDVKLTEDEAKEAVKKRFEGISSINAVLTKDNGLYEYEVSFKANEFYGDADVNAETGEILDSVIKYGTVVTIPADSSSESELISYEEAKQLVVDHAGGGTVRDIDLDREGQEYIYEVELHIDGMEKEYLVNAKTKEVILESEHECYFEEHHDDESYEVVDEHEDNHHIVDNSIENVDNSGDVNSGNNETSGLISEEEAKDIVRGKIPGAEIVEFHLEKDDGKYEYEGSAHLDGYEYEFEINAASGVITNWDKEIIEYDDDDYDDEWDD